MGRGEWIRTTDRLVPNQALCKPSTVETPYLSAVKRKPHRPDHDKLEKELGMSITISDDILGSSGLTEKEVRRELAMALFQVERLTLGQAAKLAGQTQLEFQQALASRRIPIHYGSQELDEDLRTVGWVSTH